MILQALYQLYERLADDPAYEITPLGFAPQKISFRIILKPDGRLFSIAPVSDTASKKPFQSLTVPEHKLRSGTMILPQFLCDKATYCIGLDPKTGKREGFEKHFEAFKTLHLGAEKEINCEQYSIFCRFLESWTLENSESFAKSNPTLVSQCVNFGVFEIQGEILPIHELRPVRDWWESRQPEEAAIGQCLITGQKNQAIARLHPKIKGFASAASLVGVQKNTSYESYGLEQACTAPTSNHAAFKYTSALNWMLDGKGRTKHRFYLAGTTCAYWTSKPSIIEDAAALFFSSVSDGTNDVQDTNLLSKIEVFLKTIRQGKSVLTDLGEDPDGTDFYILGMEQPNPGRFSIRFFHKSTVADFIQNLGAHQADISIEREYDKNTDKGKAQPEYPSNKDLINQTAIRLSSGKLDYKAIPPLLGGALMRSILENMPYPEGLYSAIIRRIHADHTVNYFRASIIKGTLTRNHKLKITTMLDTNNHDPAYLLGRLFATLEKIEEEGHYAQTNSKRKNTIRDKYFSSACATPATVFPRLETLSTYHRRHLHPGRKTEFDQLIAEIKWQQTGTKNFHTLKEQGNFILGYYHQRKDLFSKRETSTNSE